MSYLDAALIILACAGVWAVVELALTLHKARASVAETLDNVNQTIEQLQPVVNKMDGLVDELDPTMKQLPGLLEQVSGTIEVATVDLAHVADILGDVSSVTGTASSATTTVSKGVSSAVSGAVGAIKKLSGKKNASSSAPVLSAGDGEGAEANIVPVPDEEPAAKEEKSSGPGYVVYPEKEPEQPKKAAAPKKAPAPKKTSRRSTKKSSAKTDGDE